MSVVIIIGLPGSGKTELCKKFASDGWVVFDDFISRFYDGKAISAMEKSANICLADPRLCLNNIFEQYMTIIKKYVDASNIRLILFDNDAYHCIINANQRVDHKRNIVDTIIKYSHRYNLYNYMSYNFEIKPVYCE